MQASAEQVSMVILNFGLPAITLITARPCPGHQIQFPILEICPCQAIIAMAHSRYMISMQWKRCWHITAGRFPALAQMTWEWGIADFAVTLTGPLQVMRIFMM